MSYILNKTTGELLITLIDGSANGPITSPGQNVSDIDLFGKNYPLYGDKLDENFIKLLQNFANITPPSTPLEGELWYDISNSSNNVLRVYNGTSWLPVTPVWVATSAPTTSQVGAQWWDFTNQQLKMYNGSSWTTIGPAYSALDGKSGSLVEDVTDTLGAPHTVIKFYTNNDVSVIVSYDSAFTLSAASAVSGFNVIRPGINMSTEADNLIHGTSVNAQQLGNIAAVNYARNDIDSTFYGNINVGSGNLIISTNAGIGTSRFTNTVLNGNISFHGNVAGVSTKLLHINTATGEVTVSANAATNYGVTTKIYVDTNISTAVAPLAPIVSPALTGIPTAPTASNGTNTTQIASTAFVQNTVASASTALWLGSTKTVSTGLPTDGVGNPGDFWFQI